MFKKVNNIFLVFYGSFNIKSGSNIHILELLNNLKIYTNIVLFAPDPRGGNRASGIKYVPVINNKYLIQPSYEIMLSFYLLYSCIKNRPDVLYLRQNSFPFLPMFICKILKIPLVVEVNGLVLDELEVNVNSKSFAYKVFSYLALHSEKLNYKYCDRIVSVTDKLRDEIVSLYSIPEDKIFVINNGANTDLFKPMDQELVKKELGLENSKKYICFVGHLAAWQGVEFLIYASPVILEKQPEVRFLVVGDGVMKNKLLKITSELQLSDKFIFTGRIPYESVPLYINASEICVAPFIKRRNSKIGLSALKTYEYLACGKPMVASSIPGVKDLIEFSGGGIAVNPENPGELATAILGLLSDESTRAILGEKGRKYVVENHSWNGVARKILEVCNDVIP